MEATSPKGNGKGKATESLSPQPSFPGSKVLSPSRRTTEETRRMEESTSCDRIVVVRRSANLNLNRQKRFHSSSHLES